MAASGNGSKAAQIIERVAIGVLVALVSFIGSWVWATDNRTTVLESTTMNKSDAAIITNELTAIKIELGRMATNGENFARELQRLRDRLDKSGGQ